VLVTSDDPLARSTRIQVERLSANPLVQARGVSYIGDWGFQHAAQQHSDLRRVDLREPPPEVGQTAAIPTGDPGADRTHRMMVIQRVR
jgi:hypothetical protein